MVKIIADSTCDLGDALRARYDVQYYPFHVILEENTVLTSFRYTSYSETTNTKTA